MTDFFVDPTSRRWLCQCLGGDQRSCEKFADGIPLEVVRNPDPHNILWS
jgi:hypothetical protein